MKKFTALALIFILSSMSTSVFAGEENSTYEKKTVTKMEDRAVIAHDFDFSIDVEGGIVKAKWNKFDGEGFQWFKLVYSTTNSKPVYPEDKTMFVGNKDQLSSSFKLQKGVSKHYIRICAVTLNDDYSKDRYCSAVQSLDVTIDENPNKTDYEKKEYEKKKDYEKKDYVKTNYEKKKEDMKKNTVKKAYLSKNIKTRVDTLLENFIKRLKDKGFSDAKMVETIDIVMERLAKRKEDARYVPLISYMESVLTKYRADYNSGLGDLEDIFSDF